MSAREDDLVAFAFGLLSEPEAAALEAELARDPALRAELAAVRETVAELDRGFGLAPGPQTRARLMASIGGGRFEQFAARFGELFDVGVDRARAILGLTETDSAWQGQASTVRLLHFSGGPACAALDCGFVALAPKMTFPYHSHQGDELTLILAGRARTDDGREYGPGDEVPMGPGTAHDVTAISDEPLVFAVRVSGITFLPKPR